jgi:aminomuconate-semialdehyde/2-hydroxymuconate-6-semialdehyde dehydrogenase
VPICVRAVYAGNGQVCLAGTRLLVQRGIHDEFVARFVEEAGKLRVGDPKSPESFMGPLIEAQHLDKVHGYVELARKEGGEVLIGGERLTGAEHDAGFYYPPTVITGLTNADRTAREEIFGPVLTVIPFDTEADALAIANDTPYGLAGILNTTNLDRAHRMAARWKAGMVWINCFFERDLRLPFGGEGISGKGREGGQYSREFFTEPRAVTLRLR